MINSNLTSYFSPKYLDFGSNTNSEMNISIYNQGIKKLSFTVIEYPSICDYKIISSNPNEYISFINNSSIEKNEGNISLNQEPSGNYCYLYSSPNITKSWHTYNTEYVHLSQFF